MMSDQRGRHYDPKLLDRFISIAPSLYGEIFTAEESVMKTGTLITNS